MSSRGIGSFLGTVLPAWLAGALLSYVAIRMGLSEHYRLAFLATAVLSGLLALNPGLQERKLGFLAPLVIVLGFYSQWIPSMVEGSFSPRQETFLRGLDMVLVVSAATFLLSSLWGAAKIALWMGVLFGAIYLLAQYSGSAGNARGMIEWFMQTFDLDRSTALRYTVLTRKTIHVTFYALVAWSSIAAGWHGGLRGVRLVLYAGAIALVLAVFDESRQLTSPGRGGSGWDVLLDMSGAAGAVLLALLLMPKPTKRKVSPSLGTSP